MKVKIESIRIDGGTQPRVEIDYELVHEYSENIEQLPPVVVFNDGADHWLADGFHRYHAHKKLNLLEIEAEVKQGSKRDAVLYSVGANAQHGKRRTNADKRKAVLALLNDEEWGKWSGAEIARRCCVTEMMVSRVKRDKPHSNNVSVSSESKYTTKHGTIATMNTANIGKSQSSYTAPDEEQGGEEDKTIKREPEPKLMPIPKMTVSVNISKNPKSAADALYIHFGEEWVIDFANHILQRVKGEV